MVDNNVTKNDYQTTHQPTPTLVSPDDILAIVKGSDSNSVKILTPTQRVGVRIMIVLGGIIFASLIVASWDWLSFSPAKYIENIISTSAYSFPEVYEQVALLNEMHVRRFEKFFNTAITNSLLPVFTTVLGYVFGVNAKKEES
jgi:hypothetical protein